MTGSRKEWSTLKEWKAKLKTLILHEQKNSPRMKAKAMSSGLKTKSLISSLVTETNEVLGLKGKTVTKIESC